MRLGSRRAATTIAIAVVGIDLALLWPSAASASGPAAVGGWRIERQSSPAGAVPTSPLTDDGTMAVRNGPAGVTAFAALRYVATAGTLSLQLAGQPPPTVPAIDVCRVTSSWTPGADQTWDSRPTYDCGHHVTATVSGSQLRWQIDGAFSDGAVLDIALVPDPADTTPYAVSLTLPTAASFERTGSEQGGFEALPPPTDTPAPAAAGAPASGDVAVAGADVPNGVVAPLVAASTPAAAPQVGATPAADAGEPRSRAAGAGALAAFALILLVRSFVGGGTRGHAPRSLLLLKREGA